jgi:hypothetical protein
MPGDAEDTALGEGAVSDGAEADDTGMRPGGEALTCMRSVHGKA